MRRNIAVKGSKKHAACGKEALLFCLFYSPAHMECTEAERSNFRADSVKLFSKCNQIQMSDQETDRPQIAKASSVDAPKDPDGLNSDNIHKAACTIEAV
jgi:hypothetical protein